MSSKQFRSINLRQWRKMRACEATDPQRLEGTDCEPQSNVYRLVFLSNGAGLGKMIEIDAPNLDHAIDFASDDIFQRDVEIWENGTFSCLLENEAAAD